MEKYTFSRVKTELRYILSFCREVLVIGLILGSIGCYAAIACVDRYLLMVAGTLAFCSVLVLHALSSTASKYLRLVDKVDFKEGYEASLLTDAGVRLILLIGLCAVCSLCGAYCWVIGCAASTIPWAVRRTASVFISLSYMLVAIRNLATIFRVADARRTLTGMRNLLK
ncbi:MAG: hypothetical protein Q4C83_00390 [Candidatus Saccharibacteria bacterium]|nr:hypothetical protein [Candidatus Saccharibacteria bacterium]